MQWRMDTWHVDRIYESNQAFKISNKDKEYSFRDSSDFTISGMPTLLVLDQMQTGLYMFKPQISMYKPVLCCLDFTQIYVKHGCSIWNLLSFIKGRINVKRIIWSIKTKYSDFSSAKKNVWFNWSSWPCKCAFRNYTIVWSSCI